MGKYLSKEVVVAAYKELAHLTDDPTKQGQTQIASGLKYVVALSRFAFVRHHDLDTRSPSDKADFETYVGEVVSIEKGCATKNFYQDFTSAQDFNIGSNFFSAGVVPLSLQSPDTIFPFPRRGNAPLFSVKNGKLLIESINARSISSYFAEGSTRLAFITWLSRNMELPDGVTADNGMDEIKELLAKKYDESLMEGLWGEDVPAILSLSVDSASLFTSTKPKITQADLVGEAAADGELGIDGSLPRNYIFFGAPGTGKSYQLNKLAKECFPKKNVRRVTFYPDYTYSQFVGCFRPYAYRDDTTGESVITYRFVLGPFLETYLAAVAHPSRNYLLIVEEINRANPAATFGDVFQLLDRDADGRSEYGIAVPLEMKDAIVDYWLDTDKVSCEEKEAAAKANGLANQREMLDAMTGELRLPPNMYIWATMNSADQGVFPMDTAFKRRWDFKYMGIDDGASVIANKAVAVAGVSIVWDKLRRKINDLMADNKINEDKLLGPFFISPDALNDERFVDVFKDKVLLYLYEDAGKMKRKGLFADETATYSELCRQFEHEGVGVFKTIDPADVSAKDGAGELSEELEG